MLHLLPVSVPIRIKGSIRLVKLRGIHDFSKVCHEGDEFSVIDRDFLSLASFGGISCPSVPQHKTVPLILMMVIQVGDKIMTGCLLLHHGSSVVMD